MELQWEIINPLEKAIIQIKEWQAKHNPQEFQLSLCGLGLTSLPAELFDCIEARHLDLEGNQLNFIPREISALAKLNFLDISNNPLVSFPMGITNLKILDRLHLYNCQLTHLPSEIGNLVALKYLDLSFNKLILIPDEIGFLKKLWWLGLGENLLTILPKTLGQIAELQVGANEGRWKDFCGLSLIGNPLPQPFAEFIEKYQQPILTENVLKYLRGEHPDYPLQEDIS